ncbi:MAG: hypothetical protein CMH48_14165 [Muricauda sp.]|nr:hypothetical protein [Allomuricauda sp.]MBC31974.1 hypothetical protein [Allomuricauda sp.]|tara:strand:+ start:69006 stop:69341 length:336 start_codon:yes stop_codon:yes gene_type:complete
MKSLLTTLIVFSMCQETIGQNTTLWKITDTDSGKISTIVGTFHQFGNSFVDSLPKLKNALLQSELAIFESIDDIEETRETINSRKASNKIRTSIKEKRFSKTQGDKQKLEC